MDIDDYAPLTLAQSVQIDESSINARTTHNGHAPVPSTSKLPIEATMTSITAHRIPLAIHDEQQSHHTLDQDINPTSASNSSVRNAEPQAAQIPELQQPLLSPKGKEKARDQSPSYSHTVQQPHYPPLRGKAILEQLFEQSKMERLEVENDMLRKQLDVLLKKRQASHSSRPVHQASGDQSDIHNKLKRKLEDVQRRLGDSDAQRKRLEKELRYLRSYLLSGVDPTPQRMAQDTSGISSKSSEDGMSEDGEHSIDEDSLTVEKHWPSTHKRNEKHVNDRLQVPRKRKHTMGDARTEHLLLASARLTRLAKVVDFHPDSEYSHTKHHRKHQVSHANNHLEGTAMENRGYAQSPSIPILPPLPAPWPSNHFADGLHSPEHLLSPDRNDSLHGGILGSPIRTARVKLEAESPQVSLSNAASIFQNNANNRSPEAFAPAMQVSISATSSSKARTGTGERKIGRPLGSPNKTKLVSINDTVAAKRRSKAQGHSDTNGGKPRGRGRPLGGSPGNGRRASESQDPHTTMDGLLYAAQSLHPSTIPVESQARELRMSRKRSGSYVEDVEMEDDGGWPEPSRGKPNRERFSPRQESKRAKTSTQPFLPRGNPFVPATPASLEEPDMTRFPHEMASRTVGLPATPGPADSQNNNGPPQTPRTMEAAERTALDVLAEEAASVSKDHGRMVAIRPIEALASSARNLAHQMELARESSAIHNGFSNPSQMDGYYETSPSSGHHVYGGMNDTQSQLGDAFTLDAPGSTSDQYHYDDHDDGDDLGYTMPRTIAEQLAQGVDISHPLIDPEDIQAGMTPAAALAKKSRSPYIKWTNEEDELLVRGVAEFGTKWEAVAKLIPSRSYHQCRQRWLRGLKSGEALPAQLTHLKPQIDSAILAYENARPGHKKTESS